MLENAAAGGAADPPGEPVHFAESLNREQLPLKDIDFRRGQDGDGPGRRRLPNNQVGVDIRQQARRWWSSSCARRCPESCAGAWT